MAIHDTQPGDQRRGNPMPTNHDVRARRHADSTQSITNKIDEDTGSRIEWRDAAMVVRNADGVAKIYIGIPNEYSGDPIFAISKDGYDVLDALGIS